MTASTSAPAREQVLGAVRTGIRSLGGQRWTAPQADALCRVMDHALAVAAVDDDGTGGRAAPAIRAARAHLAAHHSEDAYLALLCAEDQFGGS